MISRKSTTNKLNESEELEIINHYLLGEYITITTIPKLITCSILYIVITFITALITFIMHVEFSGNQYVLFAFLLFTSLISLISISSKIKDSSDKLGRGLKLFGEIAYTTASLVIVKFILGL